MRNRKFFKSSHRLCLIIYLLTISVIHAESTISVLWKKEIAVNDVNFIRPYTIQFDRVNDLVRVVGVSYVYKRHETPKKQNPELFEYRLRLKDSTSALKPLMKMNQEDITVYFGSSHVLCSRLIDNDIVMVRNQYKSHDFQELTIGSDWQVKTRQIPGQTRKDVSTLGGCIKSNGEVFLCGNDGYIRKVGRDGNVLWDTNYKSDKAGDSTVGVAYSESEKVLVAFGCSFEPETKFTTKDSSLWLVNLDSEGKFIAKKKFKGTADFAKSPAFCLNRSGCPVVIYDTHPKVKNYSVVVSAFSKDLTKAWTTPIYETNDMMVSSMTAMPLEDDHTLAMLSTFSAQGEYRESLLFYLLDDKGTIVKKGIFNDLIIGPGFVSTAYKDKIFIGTVGHLLGGTEDTVAKLICFKISH